MATKEELENKLLPNQFVSLGQDYVNPIDPFKYQELVHNPHIAVKQSIYSSFYAKETLEFTSRIARVVAVKEVNRPSNYGYFSNPGIAERVNSRYYSVVCYVPDHDAAIPQADPVMNVDSGQLSNLDASKARLLQKFYMQVGGEGQLGFTPIIGDFVEVDYQDRIGRTGGYITKLIHRDKLASDNSSKASEAKNSFKNGGSFSSGSAGPLAPPVACNTPDDKLSEHFTYCQMTSTRQQKYLESNRDEGRAFLDAGKALCNTILEPIFQRFGPVNVHSGFRGETLNSATPGSSKTSQHMKFEACDFHCERATLQEVFDWIRKESNLPYGQVILEGRSPGKPTWVHVSLGEPWRPRQNSREAKIFNGSTYRNV